IGPIRRHAVNVRPPRIEVTHNVAGELAGHSHLNLHDRLEQHRTRLRKRRLEPDRPSSLERRLTRVDGVILAKDERNPHIDDGEARNHTLLERLAHPFLKARDELPGYPPA